MQSNKWNMKCPMACCEGHSMIEQTNGFGDWEFRCPCGRFGFWYSDTNPMFGLKGKPRPTPTCTNHQPCEVYEVRLLDKAFLLYCPAHDCAAPKVIIPIN